MAWSIEGASEFAVIIDAKLRIFVIAVPIRPRASHHRPKDQLNRKTSKKLSAEPMMEVAVPIAGISGQPASTIFDAEDPEGQCLFLA